MKTILHSEKIFGELVRMVESAGGAVFDVGAAMAERIKFRTQGGMDMYGRAFAPYSKKYATKKNTIVNLTGNDTVSGAGSIRMLDTMETMGEGGNRYNIKSERFIPKMGGGGGFVKFEDVSVEIGFLNEAARERAARHQFGKGRLPVRQFFGFDDEDETAAMEIFGKSLYTPRDTDSEMTIRVF